MQMTVSNALMPNEDVSYPLYSPERKEECERNEPVAFCPHIQALRGTWEERPNQGRHSKDTWPKIISEGT